MVNLWTLVCILHIRLVWLWSWKNGFCILINWICEFVNTCTILLIRLLRLWSWKTGFEFDQKVDLWSLKGYEVACNLFNSAECGKFLLPSFFGPRKRSIIKCFSSFLRNELNLNKSENKNKIVIFWKFGSEVFIYMKGQRLTFLSIVVWNSKVHFIFYYSKNTKPASQPLQTAVLYS